MILWDQHNVGDAGFRGEQSFRAFSRRLNNEPWIYQGFVAGTHWIEAVVELAKSDVFIRIEMEHGADEYYAVNGVVTCTSLGSHP